MSKKSPPSRAAADSTVSTGAIVTQSQDAPSGVNGPDGINTSSKSGAGVVGSELPGSEGPQEDVLATGQNTASGSVVSTSATENAALVDLKGLADALTMSGCSDLENLVDMAKVGLSLIEAIEDYASLPGPLQNWKPMDGPAEVVGDLYDQVVDLSAKVEAFKARPPASFSAETVAEIKQQVLGLTPVVEKRLFEISSAVRLDNVLHQEGDVLALTKDQQRDLRIAYVVVGDWDEGMEL